MEKKYIIALDQGTTSSRAILFDKCGNIVSSAQKEFTQIYPKAGWVEHNPMEIWGSQSGVLREVLETTSVRPDEIAAIGITNQRETIHIFPYVSVCLESCGNVVFEIENKDCAEKSTRANEENCSHVA